MNAIIVLILMLISVKSYSQSMSELEKKESDQIEKILNYCRNNQSSIKESLKSKNLSKKFGDFIFFENERKLKCGKITINVLSGRIIDKINKSDFYKSGLSFHLKINNSKFPLTETQKKILSIRIEDVIKDVLKRQETSISLKNENKRKKLLKEL